MTSAAEERIANCVGSSFSATRITSYNVCYTKLLRQLDQLLKATGLCESGGAAHAAIADGRVTVDGVVDTRKRAKLRPGQTVSFAGESIVLVAE